MFIRRIIKKYGYLLFNKAGLYVSKLYTPEEQYHILSRKPYEVVKQELKHLSFFISASNDHFYYNKLLKLYIPNWDLEIEKTKFIGVGGGSGNLSAFRKVTSQGKNYFEKIYFSESKDLESVLWFDKFIYPRLQFIFQIPKIKKIYRNDLLTIVYMDFLNLEPIKRQEEEKKLIETSKKLYLIEIEDLIKEKTNIPQPIFDFTFNYMVQLNGEMVNVTLLQHSIDIDTLIKKIQQSKRVLTHGDFIARNIAQEAVIIDWDSFGFFPIGMDQAYLYYYLYLKENKEPMIKPDLWLKTNFEDFIEPPFWETFKLNFYYFTLVFSWRLFLMEKHVEVQKHLINQISCLKLH